MSDRMSDRLGDRLGDDGASLEDLVAEFIDRRERGEAIDVDDFVRDHPAVETELRRALSRVDAAFALFPATPEGDLPRSVGPFRVQDEIGRGGMGRVLRVAHEDHPDTPLALKLLSTPSWLNPRAVERLRREGAALQRLAHDNIVRIESIGEVDGTPFLAMEYIEGPSLAELIRDTKQRRAAGQQIEPLGGLRAAATVLATCARAVGAAHEEGLLHRDLKPANVMLRADGAPVLIDFGLAGGDTGPTLTRTGDVLGTPQYMAPEQATSEPVGAAADVYSLGAMLYEIATLAPPHPGGDSASVLERVRTETVRPIRRVDPALPRDLETIVLRATAFRAANRYASADALAADLEAFAAGRPIAARRPGLIERSADAWRCHGRAIAIGTALLLAVIAITVLAWPDEAARRAARTTAWNSLAMAWAAEDDPAFTAAIRELAAAGGDDAMLTSLWHIAGDPNASVAAEDPATEDSAATLLAEGIRLYRTREFKAAARTLDRAADQAAHPVLAIVATGFAARRARLYDLAQAELTAALHLVPDVPESVAIRDRLASVYRSMKKYPEAEATLLDAIRLAPEDAELWHDLARVRLRLARNAKTKDYSSALDTAERAVALAGDRATNRMLRTKGQLLDFSKRFAESEPIYRELLRRDPKDTDVRFLLAYCLDAAHKMVAAKTEYETLCRMLPKHPRPRLCLAHLHSGSNLKCAECKAFFAAHPDLLDHDKTESMLLEAIRINRGTDADAVLVAVETARKIARPTRLSKLLDELIREAVTAGDDDRIASLTKAKHRLER